MSLRIVDHEVGPDARDDPSHPIPSLAVVDVMGVNKGGGADLVIVVASPLMADVRSQSRLLDKLQGYLSYLGSNEFRAEVGAPTPENTNIVVKLHPGTAPEIRDLLARSEQWVVANQASLCVQTLTPDELGVGT
jgi:hypothetical protein